MKKILEITGLCVFAFIFGFLIVILLARSIPAAPAPRTVPYTIATPAPEVTIPQTFPDNTCDPKNCKG